jgi:hypothetical protein
MRQSAFEVRLADRLGSPHSLRACRVCGWLMQKYWATFVPISLTDLKKIGNDLKGFSTASG